MRYPTERDLLNCIRQGQESAFAQIYNHYQPLMLKVAVQKFRNKQEAEDIVQNIFISLWNRRAIIPDQLPIKKYLLRAVHLQFAQFCRHERVARQHTNQLTKENISSFNQLENKELSIQIKEAIGKITAPACKKIFELAYIDDQSCQAIAACLQIKPQVVRNQTSRALKVVREELKKVI